MLPKKYSKNRKIFLRWDKLTISSQPTMLCFKKIGSNHLLFKIRKITTTVVCEQNMNDLWRGAYSTLKQRTQIQNERTISIFIWQKGYFNLCEMSGPISACQITKRPELTLQISTHLLLESTYARLNDIEEVCMHISTKAVLHQRMQAYYAFNTTFTPSAIELS